MPINDEPTPDPDQFRVLFVCTANLCRSPLAEHLLRDLVERTDLPWTVWSAGTQARDGQRMHRHTAHVLSERGLPLVAPWRSRRLTARLVAEADLVLTAEVAHRRAVVLQHPGAVRYTFTLLQFAHLLDISAADHVPATLPDGPELIRQAARARSLPKARDDTPLDLADPRDEPVEVFRTHADLVERALLSIVGAVRPKVGDRTGAQTAGVDHDAADEATEDPEDSEDEAAVQPADEQGALP